MNEFLDEVIQALEGLLLAGPRKDDLRLSLMAMKQDVLSVEDQAYCARYDAAWDKARNIIINHQNSKVSDESQNSK